MRGLNLLLIVVVLATVASWVGSSIYHSLADNPLPSDYQNIEPIEAGLDEETLEDINQRQVYEVYNPLTADKLE